MSKVGIYSLKDMPEEMKKEKEELIKEVLVFHKEMELVYTNYLKRAFNLNLMPVEVAISGTTTMFAQVLEHMEDLSNAAPSDSAAAIFMAMEKMVTDLTALAKKVKVKVK